MNPPQPKNTSTFNNTFTSLRHKEYRRYLTGFLISASGRWAQITAAGMLVYELTESATYLGFLGFSQGFASLVLALLSGVIADRVSRRKMIILTQSLMMLQALMLAALTFSGLIQAWHIIVLSFLRGILGALEGPNRLSIISELVEPEDLSNAIPLQSTFANSALVIGPLIAGFLYDMLGPGWVFMFDALTYLALIFTLKNMLTRFEITDVQRKKRKAWTDLVGGLRYAFQDHIIRLLLISLFLYQMFGLSVRNITPAWASGVLQGGAKTNSWLLTGLGFGAVIGTLIIANLSKKNMRGKLRLLGGFIYTFSFFILALLRIEGVSILMFLLIGLSSMMISNNTLGIIQTYVPDHVRGRVTGIFTMMFMGGSTLGSLLIGSIADQAGEPLAVLLFAFVLGSLTLYILVKQHDLISLS